MTLLLLTRKVWRYRLFTLPVLLLVLAGSYYAYAVKAPTWESGATYMLVSPSQAPSVGAIAKDPALPHTTADNPYLRFSSQTVLADVLAGRLTSKQVRQRLIARGADPKYTAEPGLDYGFSAPIILITGTGASAAAAVRTVMLVGGALTSELSAMQSVRRVDRRYWIRADPVVGPRDATLKGAGRVRTLAAVFAAGAILLFIVISFLDAVGDARQGRARSRFGADHIALAGPGGR